MPTFAGSTFRVLYGDGWDPLVERQAFVSVEHYPETNTDEVQIGGVGQGRLALSCKMASTSELDTLRTALAAGTVGTLAGLRDGDHTGMVLVGITDIGLWRNGTVKATLEFLETA